MKLAALKIFFLVSAGIVVTCITLLGGGKHSFNANVLDTLPELDKPLLSAADKHFSKQLQHRLVVSLTGPEAKMLYGQVVSLLQERQFTVENPSRFDVTQIARLYALRPTAVLSKELANSLSSPQEVVAFFKHQLSLIASPFVAMTLDLDPTLNTAAFLTENFGNISPLEWENNRFFVLKDGVKHYFVLATVASTSHTGTSLQEHLTALRDELQELDVQYDSTRLLYSGAPFHNAENTLLAKGEIAKFSTISLLGLALLLFSAFRSWRPFVLAHLTVLVAVVYGFAAVVIAFTEVQMLSLIFAITLIGIAIDYSLHMLVYCSGGFAPKGAVRRAISFGFVTTACGYLCFAFSDLMVLTQVAVFIVCGLTGAVAFTFFVLPACAPAGAIRLSSGWMTANERITQFQRHLATIQWPLIITATALVGIAGVTFNPKIVHNLKALNASSEQLLANEEQHYVWTNNSERRYFIVAPSLQELLLKEEAVVATIRAHDPQVKIRALSNWLPSSSQQKHNRQRLQQALANGKFASLDNMLSEPLDFAPHPELTLEDLEATSIKAVIDSQLFKNETGFVSWIGLAGLDKKAEELLNQELAEQLQSYNKLDMLNQAMAKLSDRVGLFAVLAMAITVFLLGLFEGIGVAAKSCLLLFAITGGALLCSYLIEGGLNVFHLLAAMLIIALAADYLFFYARQGSSVLNQYAISLSAISSMLVFGILTFSETPAIHSLGLTAMFGILFVFLLTPLIIRDAR